MSNSPSLALPLLAAGQAQKHVTHNEALAVLDAVVQLSVKDRSLSAPPATPDDGDRYIVAAGATGAWTGRSAEIAAWQGGTWVFHAPREGWRAWVDDEDALFIFDGAAWVDVGSAIAVLENLALLGIGTAADATNPFSAKLNKALWTAKTAAEGGDGDLRYTLNKESAADVLSLLLQAGFSGRAEIGLIGDDDLVLKVSPDGSVWVEALRIDKDDGAARFAGNVGIGVAATEKLHVVAAGDARAVVESEGTAQLAAKSYAASPASQLVLAGATGSRASPAVLGSSGLIGDILYQQWNGSAFANAGQIRCLNLETTPSGTALGIRIAFRGCPTGSATVSEIARLEHATGLSMFGANVVIDQNRHHRLRSYTIAGLPSASPAGQMIYCSDLGGGGGQLSADGTNWRRVSRGGQQNVATDAAFTLTPLTSAEEQRHTGTLTANRAVTLSTTNAYAGARFRITRTGGGAFTLDVGAEPLKSLATNSWAEVIYDGSV